MSYYRPSPTRFVWGVGIALLLALALFFAARAASNAIREDERAGVLREGDALLQRALERGAELARERDSLARLVAKVDTVVIERVAKAKAEAAKPIPSATDTSALVTAVRSCRAQLDTLATDCAAFRRTATAALAKAAALHDADTAQLRVQAERAAAITRSRDAALTQLAGRTRWQAFERGVCVASGVANLIQWRAR